jgi:hypothetical protein
MKIITEIKTGLCLIALTLLLLSTVVFAVKQDRAKCAEGIGCNDTPSPKSSDLDTKKKSFHGPGLDKNTMQPAIGKKTAKDERNDLEYPGEIDSSILPRMSQQTGSCNEQQRGYVDSYRKSGQRKSHPELDATQCIEIDKEADLYGGLINTCNFQVEVSFCAFHPYKDSWTEAFNCEAHKFGLEQIEAKTRIPAHTNNAQMIYVAACRSPEATPVDSQFSQSEGLKFRCHAWGESKDPDNAQYARTYMENCHVSNWDDYYYEQLNQIKEEKARLEREKRDRARAEARRQAEARRVAAANSSPTNSLGSQPSPSQGRGSCATERQKMIDANKTPSFGYSAEINNLTAANEDAFLHNHELTRNSGWDYGDQYKNGTVQQKIQALNSKIDSKLNWLAMNNVPANSRSGAYNHWVICKLRARIASL